MSYCRNCGSQLPETDNFCETCGTAKRGASSNVTYTGKTCPFCQFPLKADSDVTICSACGIPHHLECWSENSGCTTFGCGSLTGAPEIQFGTMISTTVAETSQSAGEIREASFDESSNIQVAGLARPISTTATGNTGQWESGKGIYKLTYQTGELPLHDLLIGARVVDPTWAWEFRTGNNYTGAGEQKPVVWIVVAKNHYEGLEPHVTLLSEELIGKHVFDNSTKRVHSTSQYGYNHYGESGTADASRGLHPWLNSSGIHVGEGIYRGLSGSFKMVVLATNVPNREWKKGTAYSTKDYVFIPSTTEIVDRTHNDTYQIGSFFPYFSGAVDAKRVAHLGCKAQWYWTRSPASFNDSAVRYFYNAGKFSNDDAIDDSGAVRPALNLKSEILVSEIK